VTATRALFTALAQLPEVEYQLDDLLSGMGIRYALPGVEDQPLAGLPAPDLDLGQARVDELLRSGRGLLLDQAGTFAKVAVLWSDPGRPRGRRHRADAHPSGRPRGLGRWHEQRRSGCGVRPLIRRAPLSIQWSQADF
jgi:hypothetical protein